MQAAGQRTNAGTWRAIVLGMVLLLALGWSSEARGAAQGGHDDAPPVVAQEEGEVPEAAGDDDDVQIALAVGILVGFTALGLAVGVFGFMEK